MKKGQVTIYIILGIVILGITGLILYARNIGIGISPEDFLKNSMDDVQKELSDCVGTIGEEAISTIGLQGGTLYPNNYVMYKNYNVNYLCTNLPNNPRCINRMLLSEDMEKEISKYVKDNIDNCFVLDTTRFSVEKGNKEVKVTIAENNVLINLKYPITLKKGNIMRKSEEVSKVVNIPLGKLYSTAKDIIESEALYGDFDPLTYMLVHRDVIIEGDKPYPDKIYIVKDNNENMFRFAIEGEIVEKE